MIPPFHMHVAMQTTAPPLTRTPSPTPNPLPLPRPAGGSSTYGELLPEGVDRLLHILDMDERSVFLDAGCGTGQALLQVALQAPQVARAVGIELSASRLEHAELAADTLKVCIWGLWLYLRMAVSREMYVACSLPDPVTPHTVASDCLT